MSSVNPAPAAPPARRDDRSRGALEILTAILLGLVSVATAIGAYQAGQWNQEAGELASISQQLRDRNLALFLETQNRSRDDGERIFDAFGLEVEGSFYPERYEELQVEQEVILGAASPGLLEGWTAWKADGFTGGGPLDDAVYKAQTFAPAQSHNVVSVIAYDASEAIEERGFLMTIVSVVFSFALLLLGVAGVSSRLGVSAVMTGGGALAFLVGVAIVIFGVF
jgi:hypothetical protein